MGPSPKLLASLSPAAVSSCCPQGTLAVLQPPKYPVVLQVVAVVVEARPGLHHNRGLGLRLDAQHRQARHEQAQPVGARTKGRTELELRTGLRCGHVANVNLHRAHNRTTTALYGKGGGCDARRVLGVGEESS
eukprot:scaffold10272_cov124-Isochrysis_galbana.AAC.4